MLVLLLLITTFQPSAHAVTSKQMFKAAQCAEGLNRYPFLRSWVSKLPNFVAPVEVVPTKSSLVHAIGVTFAPQNIQSLIRQDQFKLGVDWKNAGGHLEQEWLGKAGIESWKKFWDQMLTSEERKLVEKCSNGSCKVKLSDPEMRTLADTSESQRVARFQELVQARLQSFTKTGELKSYEGTYHPLSWTEAPRNPQLPAAILPVSKMPEQRSEFGFEVLNAEPGKHKPVVAVFSRGCEAASYEGHPFSICRDTVVYNNHYFDYWTRVYAFFPWCDGQLVLMSETVDIDQIKGSGVTRVLFGSEIRKLVGYLLETRLKRLHVLGS